MGTNFVEARHRGCDDKITGLASPRDRRKIEHECTRLSSSFLPCSLLKRGFQTEDVIKDVRNSSCFFSCSLATFGQSCPTGFRIEGNVIDPNSLLIQGAQVTATDSSSTQTDFKGHFVLPCIPSRETDLTVQAEGFSLVSACQEHRSWQHHYYRSTRSSAC
ncbi:carboxypeptidase-like regulatory domain-containing protein [Acidisarcina polymorpha]|uniref:carboxypeptidase-like regulatory domain-containing protein n=1 Tax=Acidisarcina polymorpha TaxID=2211140 RepID=UPI000DF0094B|nr:carboxypeptidase-like regulatory domain-containing protein [Acidisarcina polymorpha]